MPDELQGYDPLRVLREHEGYREKPYCDLCGKDWMECMEEREGKLLYALSPARGYEYGKTREELCETLGCCPGGTPTWGIGQTYTTKANAEVFVRERLTEIDAELRVQGFTPENIGAARFEGLKHMCYQLGSLTAFPKFVELMTRLATAKETGRLSDLVPYYAALELLWKDGSTKQDRSDWWMQEEPAPNRCEKIAEIIRENRLPESWTA